MKHFSKQMQRFNVSTLQVVLIVGLAADRISSVMMLSLIVLIQAAEVHKILTVQNQLVVGTQAMGAHKV